jgi:hypothetical protein
MIDIIPDLISDTYSDSNCSINDSDSSINDSDSSINDSDSDLDDLESKSKQESEKEHKFDIRYQILNSVGWGWVILKLKLKLIQWWWCNTKIRINNDFEVERDTKNNWKVGKQIQLYNMINTHISIDMPNAIPKLRSCSIHLQRSIQRSNIKK